MSSFSCIFQREFWLRSFGCWPSCHNSPGRRRWNIRSHFFGADNRQQKARFKDKKHQEIVTFAIAKRDTVDRLLSKALADNQITESEFQLIMTEFSQYNVLKAAVRAKLTRQSSRPDVDKIRKDV